MHLADAFFVVTALIYVAATAVFGRFLVRPSEDRNVARKGAWLLGMGMALHSAHISIAAFALHICPVQGVHFALNVASLVVVLGYLVMRTRVRIDALGAIVAPFALTFLLGSRSASSHAESPLALRSALLPFHVAANVLGIALFTLASVAAAAYLVQERPTLLYLSGPPSYIEHDVGAATIDRGIEHLLRLVDRTGCRVIMDHHAVRDQNFETRFQRLWDTGRVMTVARFLGVPEATLEMHRHKAWAGTRKPPARARSPRAIMTRVRTKSAKGGRVE